MDNKKNIPQKGAAKKWSQRLKEVGQQSPPKDLMEKLNEKDEKKKVAISRTSKDLDV